MTSDLELLGRFARKKSQDAFTALVNRHVNLVYSAALRQVRSPQLAEEIAQSVFADLARVAATPTSPTILTPWLYAVTRRTAIDVVRKESRRQLREQIAVEMNTMNATANEWTQIEPLLDDAMATLDETDRTAILLRYFENKTLREVGEALGTNDDAAQKRVSRAVERLREFFSKRNVTIGAGGLAVLISANAVQAAPVGLVATISGVAVLAGTAVHTSTIIAATKTIAMTTLQKTLVTVTVAALAGAGIYEARQAAQLREQNQTLQQRQAPLTEQQVPLAEQLAQLQRERDDATKRLAGLQEEIERTKGNTLELLKLRGEIGVLRRQLAETKQSSVLHDDKTGQQTKTWAIREVIPKTNWTNAGLATPQASVETFWWAVTSSNLTEFSKTAVLFGGKPMPQDFADKNLWFRRENLQRNQVEAMRLTSVTQDGDANATIGLDLLQHEKGTTGDDQVYWRSGNLLQLMLVDGQWKVVNDEENRKQVSLQKNPQDLIELLSHFTPESLERMKTNIPPEIFLQIIEKRKQANP